MAQSLRGRGTPGGTVLPADMRDIVDLAVASAGQWRMAGGGFAPLRPVALDLAAVDAAARWLGLAPSRRLLADLRVIEEEALAILGAPE